MLQDIAPETFSVSYHPRQAKNTDTLCLFQNNCILAQTDNRGTFALPCLQDFQETADCIFLFSLSEQSYFLEQTALKPPAESSFQWIPLRRIMSMQPQSTAFAACTAFHLATWYAANRYCGRCGHPTVLDSRERALSCPNCGHLIYPRINPAIIVGVIHGEKLLVTKYAAGHGPTQFFALIAGFCEIGESAEETVRREVWEEVGLRVQNIRYYGSQPWGIDGNLSLGYFAELEGSEAISMAEDELSQAIWVDRSKVPQRGNTLSLTAEMMEAFRLGKIK